MGSFRRLMSIRNALLASLAFFALVFAAGFALGAVREILLRPYLGASLSRLLELPVMIGITVFAASKTVRWFGPADIRGWMRVGWMAFLMLILAELALGILVLRQSLASIGQDFLTGTGFLSFLAQSLMIIAPAFVAGWRRTAP
jgi:hypothetical protein